MIGNEGKNRKEGLVRGRGVASEGVNTRGYVWM